MMLLLGDGTRKFGYWEIAMSLLIVRIIESESILNWILALSSNVRLTHLGYNPFMLYTYNVPIHLRTLASSSSKLHCDKSLLDVVELF